MKESILNLKRRQEKILSALLPLNEGRWQDIGGGEKEGERWIMNTIKTVLNLSNAHLSNYYYKTFYTF